MATAIHRLKDDERARVLRELPKHSYVAVDFKRQYGELNTIVGELLGMAYMPTALTSHAIIVKPGAAGVDAWMMQVLPASVIVRVQNVGFDDDGNAFTGMTIAGSEGEADRLIYSTDFAGATR